MPVAVALCCLCLLCVASLIVMRLRPRAVQVQQSMSLDWYLDERSHTGDLVFFRSTSVDWLHDLVSPMTHVAMIAMHPLTGEPLVVEMHDDKAVPGECAGVHVYPARDRLGSFEGALVVMPVRRPRNGGHALRLADELSDEPYPAGVRWHVAACKLAPWHCAKTGMMCSEFVQHVLARMDILKKPWRCVTPTDLMAMADRSGAYHEPYALT